MLNVVVLYILWLLTYLIFDANKTYLPDYNEIIIRLHGSPRIELVESMKRVDRSRF